MILLIYLILIFFLFNFRKKASPGLLLIAGYLISLTGGLVIGYDYNVSSVFEGFNLIFLAVTLTLIILPWNKFDYKTVISEPNIGRLNVLTIYLLLIGGFVFIVFSIKFYYSFTTVTDYSAFRNEVFSTPIYSKIPINQTVHLFAIYLCSTSYFLIPLHFYYLVKKKYIVSILCMIFSVNLILDGISIFSRSSIVLYLFIYLLYLPLFFRKMQKKAKYVMATAGIVVFVLAGIMFYIISLNRFEVTSIYEEGIRTNSLVNNQVIYSIFDYMSQWYKNGNAVMAMYSFETLDGQLSFPFFISIGDKLGIIKYRQEDIVTILHTIWGPYYDKFNGLTANLLFDFGYFGTMMFIIIYMLVLRRLQPVRGIISFTNLLILGTMFTLPAFGTFGYCMRSSNYNTLIIYSGIIYIFMRYK